MERLKVQLDKLMLEKKPYLNNKLLKIELAEMLGGKSKAIYFFWISSRSWF